MNVTSKNGTVEETLLQCLAQCIVYVNNSQNQIWQQDFFVRDMLQVAVGLNIELAIAICVFFFDDE